MLRGQEDGKNGAALFRCCAALHLDLAVVFFNDGRTHPQSKSGARVAFGAEERFKDALKVFRLDAAS